MIKYFSDDDSYYIFEIQIKEMKNENIITSKSKNEKNQYYWRNKKRWRKWNINIYPSKIEVTLIKEEKDFDYIENLDEMMW